VSGRLLLGWLLALAVLVCSGVQIAYSAHEVRRLHVALQAAQRQQDQAMAEYSRLLLELGAVAAYQNVERTAQRELDMAFPASIERVAP
jgi:cell division protein FtsL